MEHSRQILLEYVLKNFSETSFNRVVEFGGCDQIKEFDTYKNFQKHQKKIIASLTEEELRKRLILKEMLEISYLMDKEIMSPFDVSGFIFVGDLGDIIIFG